MAETVYIPYGQDEIDQTLLFLNLANDIPNKINQLAWSKKKKQRVLEAYQHIASAGITGASVGENGLWNINHNGEPIELTDKNREDYLDAAWLIQLLMSKMTPRKKEEEKKNEKLTKFDFQNGFLKSLYNNYYGGSGDLFKQEWNDLDERSESGERGVKNRKDRLIEALGKYRESLKEGVYDFKDTPFTDLNDAKLKIQGAIDALNSPDLKDDNPALNKLGFSYNQWFNNGLNDIKGTIDGQEITYQLYNDALKALEEAKTKAEKEASAKKLAEMLAKVKEYRNKFNLFNNGKTYLQLTPELIAERNKNVALKHKWGEGLTDDMIADLTALGLDSVSAGAAFAPGYGTAVSAGTGILATLAGAYADRARGESWGSTLSNVGFGLTMDAAGLIPGLGIAGKVGKMAKVVSKAAKWMGPALQIYAGAAYGPGAISAFNKFISGKKNDITSEELRDFSYAMRAIAAGGIRKAGSTYQLNRTLKKALAGVDSTGAPKTQGSRATVTTETIPHSITVKNKKYNLTDDEFKTLSGNGTRESKIKLLKEKGIDESDIEWKGINPIKGRIKPSSKSSLLSGLQEAIESGKLKWNTTAADYTGLKRFSNENFLRNYTQMTGSNGLWQNVKNRWNSNDIQTPKSTTSESVKPKSGKTKSDIKKEKLARLKKLKETGKKKVESKKVNKLMFGGQLNPSLDTIIEDFFKNSNI